MGQRSGTIVIVGAGYAGVTAAYRLAVVRGRHDLVLVDPRSPLTLTSNKGTEGYRTWWPDGTMVRFVGRSVELLEETVLAAGHPEWLNRRGYAFFTARPEEAQRLRASSRAVAARGAGEYREHPGPVPYRPAPASEFRDQPGGVDVLLDPARIRELYPFLRRDVLAMAHVRRAGFFDSWPLGQWMIAEVQRCGGRVVQDRVVGIDTAGGRVQGVQLASGERLATGSIVLAAGPHLKRAAALLGLDLPLVNELHAKATIEDDRGIVPRDVPFMLWNDPVDLAWSEDERARWQASPETRRLLETIPAGVHFRPRGERELSLIWTFDTHTLDEPLYPPPFDPHYAEVLIRGLADMIPALHVYFGRGATARVEGGYYCKTPENRPLIGPLPVEGAWVLGGLSGYGLMAAQAAGDLLAAHVCGESLPEYAGAFLPSRYDDPAYVASLVDLDPNSGQL